MTERIRRVERSAERARVSQARVVQSHETMAMEVPSEAPSNEAGRAFSALLHMLVLGSILVVLSGCQPTVKIEAPDKPIEINLNVRIEQEVRIKVDRDLDNLLASNPDLF
ncbi:MAG: YnbE family lipoprotein [Parvibaculum sp.]